MMPTFVLGALGFLKGIPLRTWALLGAGLAVAIFIGLAFHWKHQASERKAELAAICQATRDASGQPKLACGQVKQQIKFMGDAIGTLTQALDKQNAAVDAMGKESARQQAEAAQASQRADKAARGAQATSERLAASSRAGERSSAPCVPSKALTEAWR